MSLAISHLNILVCPKVFSNVNEFLSFLTLMLLVDNLAITKWCKNPEKQPKSWHMGTHLRVLSKSCQMNTNMTGFWCFSKIFESLYFGRKQPQHWWWAGPGEQQVFGPHLRFLDISIWGLSVVAKFRHFPLFCLNFLFWVECKKLFEV